MSTSRFLKSLVAGAIAALSIAASGIAQADVVVAQVNANAPTHAFFDLTAAPGSQGPFDINALDITVAGNANPVLNGSFFGFCIEPDQLTSFDAFIDPNTAGSGTGDSSYSTFFVPVSPEVQRLFDMNYAASMAGGDTSTAFNLVLQELLLEQSGTYSLEDGTYVRQGSGDFDKAASDAGSAMLAAVLAAPDAAPLYDVIMSISPDSQDFMMGRLIETPAAVPEPASLALMLGDLGAMGLTRRRRRN